jgi:hypothetical protein
MTGSDNVIIGGDPQQTLPIQSEVPEWLYKVSDLTLLFAGLLGGWGGAAGKVGALSKLLGKIPGINKLARIACRAGTLMTGVAPRGSSPARWISSADRSFSAGMMSWTSSCLPVCRCAGSATGAAATPATACWAAAGACSGKAAWSRIRTAWCGARRPAITSPSRRSRKGCAPTAKAKKLA